MKKEWTWLAAGVILASSLSLIGCGDKNNARGTSPSPGESAPAMQTEGTAPEAPPTTTPSDGQSPSGTSKDSKPAGPGTAQRG